MMKMIHGLRKSLFGSCMMFIMLATGLAVWPAGLRAADLNLSNVPLYLGGSSEPNIMFTLDDSGSMHWEIMPDDILYAYYMFPRASGIYGAGDYSNRVIDFTNDWLVAFLRSPNNVMYYNPEVRYEPWLNSDGSSFPNADPTNAYHNPYDPSKGSRNLTVNNTQYASWRRKISGGWNNATKTFYPATYFEFSGTLYDPSTGITSQHTNLSNYTRVEIKPGNAPFTHTSGNRTDCANPLACTYNEEMQNFANWYTYYRSRILTARAGVGRAFAQQGSNMRVGFAAINEGSHNIDGVTSPGTIIRGLRRFTGADRVTWFDDLYGHVMPAAGTPLRRAVDDVGQYFMRSDNRGPWGEIPGTNDPTPQSACRQSYHILMTDGYWNSSAARTNAARQNVDNQSGPLISTPTSYQYTPQPPYRDAYSNTLADVAMYYWYQDLRPTLANQVPTNSFDPAYWQHMVNFTVGLGVKGSLDPATDWAGLQAGTTPWPDGSSNQIDDLWHAAVNSRGQFFSAKDPTTFANALGNILANISSRTGSSSQVAVDANTLSTSRNIFQARFNSSDWSGSLRALPIDLTTGTIGTTPVWEAQTQISAQNYDTGRKIVTLDPGSGNGVPFRWSSLNGSQQAALDTNPDTGVADGRGAERVDYIRGRTGIAGFRPRPAGVLGDLVHSSPVFVGAPNQAYPDFWGSGAAENASPYSSFRASQASRQEMLYIGGNDGMLHAIDVATGNEQFAYVPASMIPKLNRLTSNSYNAAHQYYVDGSPNAIDVFFGGAWHTVLVGGFRGGGQGIYALDITDPTAPNEATVATKVMWEFTDADDPDLGYTFGKPSVVRMANGKWAVIFGNGYNNMEDDDNDGGTTNDSTTGNAVLYIVDVETGNLIKKFDTKQGLAQSTSTPQYANGMAAPLAIDPDRNGIVDYIYAGDLQGNLWKIDVTSTNPNSWDFAYKTGSNPFPLAVAMDASGVRQPITERVEVGINPSYPGFMIYFGTGKYLELSDNNIAGQQTQTFYGIWDKGSKPSVSITRNHLLQQQILLEVTGTGGSLDARVVSDNPIVWHAGSGMPSGSPPTTHLGWYMDLINTGASPLNNYGEKSISDPILLNGKIIWTTFLPPADPCVAGGDSWLMEVDAGTGGRLPVSALDINQDSSIDNGDFVAVNFDVNGDGIVDSNDVVAASGARSTVGGTGTPTIASTPGGNQQLKILSGTSGNLQAVFENPGTVARGRQSWIRLQ